MTSSFKEISDGWDYIDRVTIDYDHLLSGEKFTWICFRKHLLQSFFYLTRLVRLRNPNSVGVSSNVMSKVAVILNLILVSPYYYTTHFLYVRFEERVAGAGIRLKDYPFAKAK